MNTRTFILRIFFALILAVSLQSNVFALLPAGDAPQKVKYVFLFIGDGMGQVQVNAAEAYRAALQDKNGFEPLSFTRFPYAGQSTTYAHNRLITGSAAAGTALATGHKTNINRISMDPAGTVPYESVATKAKKHGNKIGIITSVSIDHATPAVFYAHQPDRDMYFEIGIELAQSGFDYFAGGGFLIPEGTYQGQAVNLLQFVADQGYQVVNTAEAFISLAPGSGKTLVISPIIASGAALPFAMDMHPSDLTLADFTAKGITMLAGDEGFFMMVEGGKIDWACHANDAAATIHEVIAFDKAVEQALAFYEKHPDETLIIVTSDHETGGMGLGNAKMKYETNTGLLKYQKSSVDELNKIVRQFRISKSGDQEADFNRMLKVLQNDLGLNSERYGTSLSEEETSVLRDIFTKSIADISPGNSNYENYEPFMSKAMAILNQKAGISWGTGSHTAVNVPVYAIGAGAEKFTGVIDNTDIPRLIGELMGVW